MICSVCQENRHEVHARKSRLMPGAKLFLCNECLAAKREPRHIIVIVGRGPDGWNIVKDYIKNRRYVGREISTHELV